MAALFRYDFTALPSKSLFVHSFITKQKFEVNDIRKNILENPIFITPCYKTGIFWGFYNLEL